MNHNPHIIEQCYRMPDDDEWLRIDPGAAVVGQADSIAERYTDTRHARKGLAEAIVKLNRQAMRTGAGDAYAWVPDRRSGEPVIYGYPGKVVFDTAEEATAEAYAAKDPSTFVTPGNRIVGYHAALVQRPAGPSVVTSAILRENSTTTTCNLVMSITFPQVVGLREALSLAMFTYHSDMDDKASHFISMVANSLGIQVQLPDNSIVTVGPWEE